MSKVIVTGGAGFIGSHMVDALVEAGHDVQVIDNLVEGVRENVHKDAELHVVDICDAGALADPFKGVEYVFHLAALPRVQFGIDHPREAHETNVTGTYNVILAAAAAGAKRLIFSSSSSIYGDQDCLPLREDMPAHPKSPYAAHKYFGEVYCRLYSQEFGLSTVSLRYFNAYGPRQNPSGAYALVIPKFLQMRKEGKSLTITGDGSQTRDFTHTDDIVCASLLALASPKVGRGEVINIGAGKNASVSRIAELIGGPVEHIAARLEPHDTLADISRAKKLLGWEPRVSLEDGIAELKREAGIA